MLSTHHDYMGIFYLLSYTLLLIYLLYILVKDILRSSSDTPYESWVERRSRKGKTHPIDDHRNAMGKTYFQFTKNKKPYRHAENE